MGQYVDKMDNLVEGLLDVIPISYLLSPTFEEDIQKSIYRNYWNNCISIPASISKLFVGEEAAAESKLRHMCNSQNSSVPSLYKFVSFLISAYCSHNNKKVNLKEIKEALKSFGVAKFDKINQWDSSDYHIDLVDNKREMTIASELTSKQSIIMEGNKEVFIVHGHNKLTNTNVENVLLKLGLKPIVLAQQPNEGDTIFEKFEKNGSRANYAIILLTADDEGKAKDEDNYKFRARQNVIFEMGYFVAKLGRKNICYLYEEGVDIPSDIKGIAYVELKDNNWPFQLVKELKKCDFDVSADKL